MTDPVVNEPAAPKPKVKVKRRRRKPVAKAFNAPEEFAGMTANNCCSECKPGHCVISQSWVCAHPFKSPLPATMMNDSKTVARYNRAKKALAHQKLDLQSI